MRPHFQRHDLAEKIAQRLSPDPILGAEAGLFLAGPRRTGKSAFLRQDLIPLLQKRGLQAIYVDLWANRDEEPARLIAQALISTLTDLASDREKLMRSLPFSTVSVGGIKLTLNRDGPDHAGTLTDLLVQIGKRAKSDIVLIVDEAQDALNSDTGKAAMFALKAARDHLNQTSDLPDLYLLFTGSSRDKLSDLVHKSDQAFYGAAITEFPLLGRDYIDDLVARLNPRLADDNKLDADDVLAAFKLVGHRPEYLHEVIRDHILTEKRAEGLSQTVREQADELKARRWREHQITFDRLTDLQQTLLRKLAVQETALSPFSEAAVTEMGNELGRPISASDVQKAMKALRDDHIVWHRARGLYLVEDRDMREWLQHRFGGQSL